MVWYMGIDIGSATTKGVIAEGGKSFACHVLPSGANYTLAAKNLREELLTKAGLLPENVVATAVTGCGTGSASFRNLEVTSLRCCARGINAIFPSVRTVIEVGEQSTQVIRLSDKGKVIDFTVSERCAAGSGRFLRVIARVLGVDLKDIGPLSLKSKNPVTFTTGCAVFGESEAISRVAEGIAKEDIVAGVHKALADKISSLIDRVKLEERCAISGGGGLDVGLIKTVEDRLGIQLLVPPNPLITTALGAAIIAGENQGVPNSTPKKKLDWEDSEEEDEGFFP